MVVYGFLKFPNILQPSVKAAPAFKFTAIKYKRVLTKLYPEKNISGGAPKLSQGVGLSTITPPQKPLAHNLQRGNRFNPSPTGVTDCFLCRQANCTTIVLHHTFRYSKR